MFKATVIAAGAAAVFAGLSSLAGAQQALGQTETSVGIGMICNSQQQAVRFVELRTHGSDAQVAMALVNAEADDPRACGMAAIAFTRDGTLDMTTLENDLVQIVRINVVAGFNGAGWQPVTNLIQYAVMQGEGESI